MKRLLLVGLLLVLASCITFAGTPITKQGTHGLWFQMQGLGTFGVDGPAPYAFGGHYFIQDDMALRLGVGFNMAKSDNDNVTPTEESTSNFYSINPALLWFCVTSGPVSGYWGPQFEFASGSTEVKEGGTTITDIKSTGWGVGVVVGAHYWAMDMLSFNAEYSLSYSSVSGEVNGTDTATLTNFGIDTWALGLNWWFDR